MTTPEDTRLDRRLLARELAGLVERVDAKEGYAHRHARQVAALADAVARELGLRSREAASVRLGAFLHDVGKLRIPEEILRKPGPLDEHEWALMRRHAEEGERVLVSATGLVDVVRPSLPVLSVVRSHHERWDGGGYPDGLEAGRIPVGARVVAVCDAFEAMTEDRAYRPARPREDALGELSDGAGGQWDPACVRALLKVARREEAVPRTLRAAA